MPKKKFSLKLPLKRSALISLALLAATTVAVAVVITNRNKNIADISTPDSSALETHKGAVMPNEAESSKVTEAPTTEAPATDPPVTEAPTTEPPVTEPLVTEPPVTKPPVTEPPVTEPPVTEPPVTEPPVTEPPVTEPPVTEPPVTEPPVTEPPVTEPPVTEPPVTEPPVTEPPVTEPPVTEPPAPTAHPFDNALFIGDSRTTGLSTYADLGKASVFATKGMNVYRLFKEAIITSDGQITLEKMLAEKKYDKIYIMLGINEIGYPANSVIKKYTEVVGKVRAAQPDATIYIQANLHITSERSEKDKVYNNANLNKLNEMMAQLADGEKIFYIDANHIFDDEKGGLNKDYAFDDFHLLGRYYTVWAEWIAQNS